MFAYWLLYLLPAFAALSGPAVRRKFPLGPYLMFGVIVILFVGYREVGGDWYNYLMRYQEVARQTFDETIRMGDPGYNLLVWFMADLGVGFFGVTVFSAAAFITGLFIFSYRQPNPWLGVAVAVPYLVIVVGMGYMRQAIALGFVFWGLSRLERGDFKSYVGLVALGATFHTTAVIMIPLAMFIRQQGKILRAVAIGLLLYVVWDASLAQRADHLWENYVEAEMQSQGAMIRVMMNVAPALVFLYYRKEWQRHFPNYFLWMMLALGAVAAVPLVGFASTAVDRMSLYATPLQVAVFARLPLLVGNPRSGSSMVTMVVLGYALVLFVWLNFATHSGWWLPYRNALF